MRPELEADRAQRYAGALEGWVSPVVERVLLERRDRHEPGPGWMSVDDCLMYLANVEIAALSGAQSQHDYLDSPPGGRGVRISTPDRQRPTARGGSPLSPSENGKTQADVRLWDRDLQLVWSGTQKAFFEGLKQPGVLTVDHAGRRSTYWIEPAE